MNTASIGVPVATVWTAPDAPRPVDDVVTADDVDMPAWMSRLDSESRLDLLGRVGTQAILGEPVVVVAERSGWAEIRLPWQTTSSDPTGYPGWVPLAHLAETETKTVTGSSEVHPSATVTARLALAHLMGGRQPTVVSIGTIAPVVDTTHSSVLVDLGRLGNAWFAKTDVRVPRPEGHAPEPDSPDEHPLVRQASVMLGVPYLWGGLSGWGVDCSGLVHLSNRTLGHRVARDSGDLHRDLGRAALVGPTGPAPDDLLFFRHPDGARRIHHVGIAVNNHLMLHSPKTGRVVELLPYTADPYKHELERSAS